MGLRFRRRLRLAKGIYVNLSKSGASVSLGGRGATVNLSRRGTRSTIGLPGSGVSYRSATRPWSAADRHVASPGDAPGRHVGPIGWIALAALAAGVVAALSS